MLPYYPFRIIIFQGKCFPLPPGLLCNRAQTALPSMSVVFMALGGGITRSCAARPSVRYDF